MEEKDFNAKYWFNPMQNITVVNPDTEDLTFSVMVETGIDMMTGKVQSASRDYTVEAGKGRTFPGPIANMYLDKMFKRLIQKDNRVSELPDYGARQEYYEKLIVSKTDMAEAIVDFPVYQTENMESVEKKAEEVAFEMVKDDLDAARPANRARAAAPSEKK